MRFPQSVRTSTVKWLPENKVLVVWRLTVSAFNGRSSLDVTAVLILFTTFISFTRGFHRWFRRWFECRWPIKWNNVTKIILIAGTRMAAVFRRIDNWQKPTGAQARGNGLDCVVSFSFPETKKNSQQSTFNVYVIVWALAALKYNLPFVWYCC